MTIRVLVFVAVSVAAVPAFAQINPYQPPFPGAVLIQPCGQAPGWVPANHPSATDPASQCVPPKPAPNPEQPWTLASDEPMTLGGVYRDPYGIIYYVTRVELRLVQTEAGDWVTVGDGDLLVYHSIGHYHRNEAPQLRTFDPLKPRGVRWAVQP